MSGSALLGSVSSRIDYIRILLNCSSLPINILDECITNSVYCQLRERVEIQILHDSSPVRFNRLNAYSQNRRNLLVPLALSEKPLDSNLPRAQLSHNIFPSTSPCLPTCTCIL